MPAPTRFHLARDGSFTAVLDSVAAAATTLSMPTQANATYIIDMILVKLTSTAAALTAYSVDVMKGDGVTPIGRFAQQPAAGLPNTTFFQQLLGPLVCAAADPPQVQVNTTGLTTPGIAITVSGRLMV